MQKYAVGEDMSIVSFTLMGEGEREGEGGGWEHVIRFQLAKTFWVTI